MATLIAAGLHEVLCCSMIYIATYAMFLFELFYKEMMPQRKIWCVKYIILMSSVMISQSLNFTIFSSQKMSFMISSKIKYIIYTFCFMHIIKLSKKI